MTVAQRNTANLMIAAKGQAVTITRRTAGAYNTATSSATVTETTQTAKAVILPFPMGLRKQAGTTITAGDVQCLLAAGTLTAPQVDDMLTIASGLKYAITEVNPLSPAGLTIFYDLTLRGSIAAVSIPSIPSIPSILTILASTGASYTPGLSVLSGAGAAYTITAAVLDSSGTSYTVS